jgi:hypothetical protein
MIRTRLRLAGFLVPCVLSTTLLSCESDSGDWTPDDLFGLWISQHDTGESALIVEMREFDSDHPRLSGVTPVYFIVEIPPGCTAEVTQYGQFDVRYEGGTAHWVTIPLWARDEWLVGDTYGNEIHGLDDDEWQIESSVTASGVRTFRRIDAYPEE